MIRMSVALLVAVFLLAGPHARAHAQSKPQSTTKATLSLVVNINTAPAAELESLPGVGAKTAALIIEYRQKNGPFRKLEELMNVRGMGEKTFLKLRPQLTVGTAKPNDRP